MLALDFIDEERALSRWVWWKIFVSTEWSSQLDLLLHFLHFTRLESSLVPSSSSASCQFLVSPEARQICMSSGFSNLRNMDIVIVCIKKFGYEIMLFALLLGFCRPSKYCLDSIPFYILKVLLPHFKIRNFKITLEIIHKELAKQKNGRISKKKLRDYTLHRIPLVGLLCTTKIVSLLNYQVSPQLPESCQFTPFESLTWAGKESPLDDIPSVGC